MAFIRERGANFFIFRCHNVVKVASHSVLPFVLVVALLPLSMEINSTLSLFVNSEYNENGTALSITFDLGSLNWLEGVSYAGMNHEGLKTI